MPGRGAPGKKKNTGPGPRTFTKSLGRLVNMCPHLVRPRLPPSCAAASPCCVLALCILALCALALRMLELRVPAVRALAVRALAVRARAVCLRAGRVVCLCSVRLDRADFARRRRRHLFSRLPPITLLLLAPHVHTMLYSGSPTCTQMFPHLINTAPGVRSDHLHGAQNTCFPHSSLSPNPHCHISQAPGKNPLPFPTSLPSPRHQPLCALYPPPHLILCMPILSCMPWCLPRRVPGSPGGRRTALGSPASSR